MKTKHWLIILALILPLAWSCKQKEVDALKGENLRLSEETLKKDSTIQLLFAAFNEIEENLEVIKSKQNVISESSAKGTELSTDARDRINQDIQLINDLMDKNKRRIASLNKKLKDANLQIAEFEKVVARMQKQIDEKDAEVNTLKEQLVKMNFKVEELNARVDTLVIEGEAKTKVIEGQTAELNTAYYVFGTAKEFKEKGIVTKAGLFGGKKLGTDLDRSYFTKVDITKFKEIPLNCKKARLLTTHATGTYKLQQTDNKVEKLVITDAAKFWEVSKYLVIEIEQ
jgi:adenylosuccinate synthase